MAVLHWKLQRITAILLTPIMIYLACYLLGINDLSYSEIKTDIASPLGFIFIIVSSIAIFLHSSLGITVIIEDYIHSAGIQKLFINISKLLHILIVTLIIFSTLNIASYS
ncbi:MAG: succinate dehydrogenase, hydrophobic membrane anchor protein [Pseudomonadota bacterium]|nr:succinate dehydrogenase, hydrophobic membrane anchor protein [Pseudomonadota bacterium]